MMKKILQLVNENGVITMYHALGCIEYKTVIAGVMATDQMIKTAKVDIVHGQVVHPGKYVVFLTGGLGALQAVIEKGKKEFPEDVIDHFLLGNIHPLVLQGLKGTCTYEETDALGMIETSSIASMIVAADQAAKTTKVELIQLRFSKEMGGKAYVFFTGELAAVSLSVEAGANYAEQKGFLIKKGIVPAPDAKTWDFILNQME